MLSMYKVYHVLHSLAYKHANRDELSVNIASDTASEADGR